MAEKTSVAARSREQKPKAEPDLAEALAHERQEVLRLRDLLIARDAELGIARGQLAELQANPLNLSRLRVLVPGLLWRIAIPRRLRR